MTDKENDQPKSDMSFLDATTAPTGQSEEVQQPKDQSQSADSSPPAQNQEQIDKALDEKYEKEEWARKRLNRQEQRHRREMQEMMFKMQQDNLKILNALQNQSGQSKPDQQQNQNYTNNSPHELNTNNIPVGNPLMPDFDFGQDQKIKSIIQKELAIEKAKQEELKRKEEQEKLVKSETGKAEAMRAEEAKLQEKYGDYHDIIYEAMPYLTKEIAFALKELPPESLENFYLSWKEDKNQIIKISQLAPFRQALEVARLDALMSTKRLKKENSSPNSAAESQFIKPVKPSVASGKHWLDHTYADMTADYRKHLEKK